MKSPTTGTHLQQFICAVQWVRMGIPKFTNIIECLHLFMERIYQVAGKRTRRAVATVQLATLGWGKQELESFQRCKKALVDLITLAFRDEGQRLCIYTDAWDSNWAGVVTQVSY